MKRTATRTNITSHPHTHRRLNSRAGVPKAVGGISDAWQFDASASILHMRTPSPSGNSEMEEIPEG
jgi:hypothetical protein